MMKVRRSHGKGKRGKVAGRGEKSPEGYSTCCGKRLLMTETGQMRLCLLLTNGRIYAVFSLALRPYPPHPLPGLSPPIYVTVPSFDRRAARSGLSYSLSLVRACQHSTPDSGQPLALPQLDLSTPWPQGPPTPQMALRLL